MGEKCDGGGGAAVEVGGELDWRTGGNNAMKLGRARVRVPAGYCHVKAEIFSREPTIGRLSANARGHELDGLKT